jgi:ABC-type bacteriocin/lantibiotic exporter with double-glycine peptidase domain
MLDIPDVRQGSGHDCGPAVFRAVVAFFGLKAPAPKADPLAGLHPEYLEPLLREAGLQVLSGEMDTDDLKYHTRRGRPVVCLIRHGDTGHYVVASGVSRGRVHYHCPLSGPSSVPAAEWDARWTDRDRRSRFRRFGMAVWKEST